MIRYKDSETNAENVAVHGKECVSCIKHGKDVMIAVTLKQKSELMLPEFRDIYLTTDLAAKLLSELAVIMLANEKDQE